MSEARTLSIAPGAFSRTSGMFDHPRLDQAGPFVAHSPLRVFIA